MSSQTYSQRASDIITRLKSALKVDSDTELCRLMNIHTNTLANWKSRGNFNEKPIIAFCESQHLDLNWVFFGKASFSEVKSEKSRSDVKISQHNDLLVQSLLKTINLLEDRIAKSEATLKRAEEYISEKAELERKLKEKDKELDKVNAQLTESQKKLRSALENITALREAIATLKKKKAA